MEDTITTALEQAQSTEIATWTDSKKNEFVKTFHDRLKVSRAILEMTAQQIISTAQQKRFISAWHTNRGGTPDKLRETRDYYDDGQGHHYYDRRTIGGRTVADLTEIAKQRAEAVLENLPPLATAVRVIQPDVAKKIKRVKDLTERGTLLAREAEEVSEPVAMADLDQDMTIGAFRKMVKDLDDKRTALLTKMREVGHEASTLQASIDKELYKGLPGLSDAVVETAISYMEQSKALAALGRRVEEQIKFGDSEEALTLLRRFEEDEATVSQEVAARFAQAIETLRLAVGKKRARK